MGQRNAGISGGSRSRRDPGYHREGDTRRLGGFELFGAAPEHEGIAPLEAHHPLAGACMFDQQFIDFVLGHAMGPSLLADADAFGIAANEVEHLRRHQLVIQHHLGLLDLLQPLEGQEPGITGTGPNQHNFPPLLLALGQLIGQPGATTRLIATLQQGGQARGGKCPLPVATTLADRVKSGLHLAAQLAGQTRQRAQVAGQQGFEPFAQQASQHGSGATTGDRHHDGRTIDDGGEDEAGARRIIHHVDPQTSRIGGGSHRRVDHFIIGSGNHQPLLRQLLGAEFAIQIMQSTGIHESL